MTIDRLDPAFAEQIKAKQLAAGIQFAQQYGIFKTGSGANLLQHWRRTILERCCPANASLQEFAFHEGQRMLILGIIQQLQLADTKPEDADPFAV
jgi:hypothetical protein